MSGIPVFTTPPIDPKTGQWNRQWWLFMQTLWERTGGFSDITDGEASGLSRSATSRQQSQNDSSASAPTQRSNLVRQEDQIIPTRHHVPSISVTKETYKPLTLIRLFIGLAADIPSGWQLADGTNGTPNMKDLFVVGAGNLYASGSTGGSTTISTNNIPAHTHPYNDKDTTYTANTVSVQSGSGTTVVQSITANPVDTPRTTGNNTTTAQPYLPPYYAAAYIINTKQVTIVTDIKLR